MSRETAWSPVGLDIPSTAKTVEDVLNAAQINFKVHKNPIFDEHGNSIPGWFRNTRSDNGATLGIVTGKYNIIQNADAFDFVNNLVSAGIEFEKGGIWHNGSAIWLEAKLPGEYKILGDDVDSHVVFINSHNGKGAVKVAMVPNRLFCSNQLNFALKKADRMWSVVHSTQINTRLAEAQETLGLANTYMKALAAEAESLVQQKFTVDEFNDIIKKIYPTDATSSNRRLTNVEAVTDGLMHCLEAPDLANFKNTKWAAAMAITDYFDHATPQRITAGFADARWEKVATGHRDVDKFYEMLVA